LIRARALFWRSQSWRSKIRKTASAIRRYELDELVQHRRDARHDRGAAADEHLGAADGAATVYLLRTGAEGDVVDA